MIEDVDYLLENCEKDSMVFYVDSSLRDRFFYQSASEYTIDFDQPFKLVYGIDILDASIPTTEYNVDLYNNRLVVTLVGQPTLANLDLKLYFRQLSTVRAFGLLFNSLVETNIIALTPDIAAAWDISSDTHTVFDDLSKVVNDKYYVAVRYVKESVQFNDVRNIALTSQDYVVKKDDLEIYISNDSEYADEIINILKTEQFYLQPTDTPYVYDVVYYIFYVVSYNTYTAIKDSDNYMYVLLNMRKLIDAGNFDISSLRVAMNNILNTFDIYFESKSTVERQEGKLNITSPKLIALNAEQSSIASNLGFDTYPTVKEVSLYDTYNIGSCKRVFVSNTYDEENRKYILYAPGIVNLLGERYVILRCKEIEDHLLGSFAYTSFTPGIGMFKLAASYNDVTNLRFDFVSLVRKPFHPIGKLSRLSFRFETSSGRVYDFKGVNHQLLMMVKFLVPSQKKKFERSVLNPNYNANFMEYMARGKSIQYKEDSDDEEEFDNDKYYNVYKSQMNKYDYSSSGDDTDSDDSEEKHELTNPRRQ